MSLKKKIGNIIWHIENNRGVLGDTQVLDQVLESLKKIENDVPKDTRVAGNFLSTGLMKGIHAQASVPATAQELIRRTRYGTYNGYKQWDLAIDFFRMSNDAFFKIYGFNFVPRGRLFDDAKSFVANQEGVFRGGGHE